jgi:hypothetical protein
MADTNNTNSGVGQGSVADKTTTTTDNSKAQTDAQKADASTQPTPVDIPIVSNGQTLEPPKEDNQTSKTETGETKTDTNTDTAPKDNKGTDDVTTLQKDLDNRKQSTDDAKKLLADKKIDFNALQNEYDTNGHLTEDTFKKLEDAGFPRSVVNSYVAGLEAQAERYTNAVYGFAGGKEEYGKLTDFVKTQGNEQVNAFNKIIELGDVATCKMYIEGIKAQMVAKHGTSNPTLLGKASAPAVEGYQNAGEMIEAMSDKRYGYDANYTKAVQAKLQVSHNIVG